MWINYLLTWWTDPGKVPNEYKHQPNQHTQLLKSSNLKSRYCRKCKVYKPPRAHHCSVCERCILKMDHHCVWVGNCIGYANQPYFIRFVVSTTLLTWFSLLLIAVRMVNLIRYQNQLSNDFSTDAYLMYLPPSSSEILTIVVNSVVLIILSFLVGGMTLFQISYLLNNTTTIEVYENYKINEMVEQGKIEEKESIFPFDLGWKHNVDDVLGTSSLLWWLPRGPPGNGLEFQVNSYIKQYKKKTGNPYVWPPSAYLTFRASKSHSKCSDCHSSDEESSTLRRRVRKGSEGYEVREYTEEERQEMLSRALNDASESASSFGSVSD